MMETLLPVSIARGFASNDVVEPLVHRACDRLRLSERLITLLVMPYGLASMEEKSA